MTRVVVLDIEGTTSATNFVVETLFPFARERYASYLREHGSSERVRDVLAEVRAEIGEPSAADERIVATLEQWTDADAKVTPLKTIQGWIWQDAFTRGELASHFFPDVAPALRRWHDDGLWLAVFSSGSIDAQRAWFAHSADGDLTGLIVANFDTQNAGPKALPASYDTIARTLDVPGEQITFLSDTTRELDAARAAGWPTFGVRRPGEPAADTGVGDHAEVASFAEVQIKN